MLNIPDCIKKEIGNEPYEIDRVGLSGSSILLFADKVLKICEDSDEAKREVQALRWLTGRLSVPRVLAHTCEGGKSYLLMTRVAGQMACDETYLRDPKTLTERMAQALQTLWRVDLSDCPLAWSLDQKLAAAAYRIKKNLVTTDDADPDTYGANGFENPAQLLQWLIAHKPTEELVLSHGDFCLPNLYIENGRNFHFIDLGRMGIGDKWQDIALCYRSLKYNYDGKYGGTVYPGYDPNLLFEMLGIAPDWEKLRYYILLDELF